MFIFSKVGSPDLCRCHIHSIVHRVQLQSLYTVQCTFVHPLEFSHISIKRAFYLASCSNCMACTVLSTTLDCDLANFVSFSK